MSIGMLMLITAGCGVMAILLLTLALIRARSGARVQPVLEGAQGVVKDGGPSGRKLSNLGGVLRPSDQAALGELQLRTARAGLYNRDAVDLYLSVRLFLLLALPLGGLLLITLLTPGLLVSIFLLMALVGTAVVAPSIWLDMRTQKRQLEISQSLPITLDLLVTCLEAGLGLEQALGRVSNESVTGDSLLARELRLVLAEIQAGLPVPLAFRKFAARVGSQEVANLATVLTQATTLGGNITDVLRGHANALRQHRMLMLEEKAGKANAKITLPLTMCLLPAALIPILGPAILLLFRSM